MASRSSRRKPCIPIADDDPDIRESMCDAIASWHCVALAAAWGQEALGILDHRHVDAVLCDLVMSGMVGAETLREIRHRVPALPAIMMSAMMTPDLRQHFCHIGAQACLAKPMDRKELALALSPDVFRQYGNRDEAVTANRCRTQVMAGIVGEPTRFIHQLWFFGFSPHCRQRDSVCSTPYLSAIPNGSLVGPDTAGYGSRA